MLLLLLVVLVVPHHALERHDDARVPLREAALRAGGQVPVRTLSKGAVRLSSLDERPVSKPGQARQTSRHVYTYTYPCLSARMLVRIHDCGAAFASGVVVVVAVVVAVVAQLESTVGEKRLKGHDTRPFSFYEI